MDAKTFLKQYERAVRRADDYREEYEREQELIDAIRASSNIDGMPHGNSVSRKVEDQAIRLADKALEWKDAEMDAIRVRQKVFDAVMQLDDPEREVLKRRYVYLQKWDTIADGMCYTTRGVLYIHARALDKISLHCFSL